MEEHSSEASVEEVISTRLEINDSENPQPEFEWAQLRYEGSLLIRYGQRQSSSASNGKRAGGFSLIRTQKEDGSVLNVFVKLHDRTRGNKQPASRHHTLLRLQLDPNGFSPGLHSYRTRYTTIFETTGRLITANDCNPCSLHHGIRAYIWAARRG